MHAGEATSGEMMVKLEGKTPIEQALQDAIDGKAKVPAGPCRVVSPDLLNEAIDTIRSLRIQLHDKCANETVCPDGGQ